MKQFPIQSYTDSHHSFILFLYKLFSFPMFFFFVHGYTFHNSNPPL